MLANLVSEGCLCLTQRDLLMNVQRGGLIKKGLFVDLAKKLGLCSRCQTHTSMNTLAQAVKMTEPELYL